jgi:hypothetical protein
MIRTNNNSADCSGKQKITSLTETQIQTNCNHEYGEWSDCDASCNGINTYASGRMERKLLMTIPEMYGGKSCDDPIISQSCTKNNCKVDCSGNWGNWSNCNANTGTKTRTFNISIKPSNNGDICPTPETIKCQVDCSGNWSNWSDCNANTGTKTRTYETIINPLNNGVSCPEPETIKCPVNCKYEYGNWDVCDATCNGIDANVSGKMKRLLNIIPEMNGGDPCDSQMMSQMSEMYIPCSKNCPVSNCSHQYGQWKDCVATCNGSNARASGNTTRSYITTYTDPIIGGRCDPPIVSQACTKTNCTQNRNTKPNDASNIRCGINHNKTRCTNVNECCSMDGWCGKGNDYCNNNTQKGFCANAGGSSFSRKDHIQYCQK